MRNPLLVTGLGLLVLSLLLTAALLSGAPVGPDGVRGFGVGSWFANAALYVGSGLTVAGAVLRELRPPAERAADPGPGRDGYASE